MNADPQVMEFMPRCLSVEESNDCVDRIEIEFTLHHYGLFAAELREAHAFIGYIGLSRPDFAAAFTPCVEIGWRLAAVYWGRGLATEGARAVVAHAFDEMHLPGLVSFTVPGNFRSRRVMEKIGMTRNPAEDFDHPKLPQGHFLRRHVLYRIDRASR